MATVTYTLYPKYRSWENKNLTSVKMNKRKSLVGFSLVAKTLMGVKDAKVSLHPSGDMLFLTLEPGVDLEVLEFLYLLSYEMGVSFPVELRHKVKGNC